MSLSTRKRVRSGTGLAGRRLPAWRIGRALPALLLLLLVASCGSSGESVSPPDMRDFPPLANPNQPQAVPSAPSAGVAPAPGITPTGTRQGAPAPPAAPAEYTLGVGDEVDVAVLGQGDFSRTLKVRPDGNITSPGAGVIFALGRTPEDVGREIERKLSQYIRYPRVDLVVNSFGDRRVYVMGEVSTPGDQPFHKGMTALQAIAAAGGLRPTGKAANVILLRRTGADSAYVRTMDFRSALKGENESQDVALEAYDIVYVPRSVIDNIDIFMDQYVKQMIAPFNLYLAGWQSFNAVRVWHP